MTIRVGINGFGRIGRNFFRAVARHRAPTSSSSASNDLTDNATLAHLLKYDSILGRLPHEVKATADEITRRRQDVQGVRRARPGQAAVGRPRRRRRHRVDRPLHRRHQGAGCTPTTAPRRSSSRRRPRTRTSRSCMGVNDDKYDPAEAHDHLERLLHHELPRADGEGPERHVRHRARSDDHDPRVHPGPEPAGRPAQDLRRARAAALNIVPTSTGAAKAIGLVLPELKGKLDGFALRVPIPTGSATDLTVTVARETTVDEVNAAIKAAAEGPLKGYPDLHRGPDRLLGHRHRPGVVHLRRRPDQGDRQPGQGRRLVRQRVGLLEPPRRPRQAGRVRRSDEDARRPARRGRLGSARARARRPERPVRQGQARRDHRRRPHPGRAADARSRCATPAPR